MDWAARLSFFGGNGVGQGDGCRLVSGGPRICFQPGSTLVIGFRQNVRAQSRIHL